MKSPVTHSKHVTLVAEFPAGKIIAGYQEKGISVERFFKDVPAVGLYECEDTGYRFYYPETIFGDGQFYADLQVLDEDYYPKEKWEHGYAAGQLRPSDLVLEVGAGDGFFLDILKNKGIQARGLELNPMAIEACRAKGLQVDGEMIQQHAQANEGKYDAVCAFQVLEHIYDVKDFLTACIKALKKGGKLIIGVPNNNPYLYKHDDWHLLNLPPHHAGLWGRKAFTALPDFYDIKEEKIIVEPLHNYLGEYKEWFHVQRAYHQQHHPAWGGVLSLVPRPVYKAGIKLLSPFIEGKNIVAIFTKT